jgi:hypothetical protein
MELAVFDEIEIDVNVEPSPRSGYVHSASGQFFVSKQIRDAGRVRKINQESRRREQFVKPSNWWRETSCIGNLYLFPFIDRVEGLTALRQRKIERGIGRSNFFGEVGIEKVVNFLQMETAWRLKIPTGVSHGQMVATLLSVSNFNANTLSYMHYNTLSCTRNQWRNIL